jgi:hypothetical protein
VCGVESPGATQLPPKAPGQQRIRVACTRDQTTDTAGGECLAEGFVDEADPTGAGAPRGAATAPRLVRVIDPVRRPFPRRKARAKLTLKLNRTGRRLLAQQKRLRVLVSVRVDDARGHSSLVDLARVLRAKR